MIKLEHSLTIIKPVEGGTEISATGQIKVGGFLKLTEPVVARIARRLQENIFANLKDLLEAQE